MTTHLADSRRCKSVIAGIRNVIRLMSDPRVLALPAGFGAQLRRKLGVHFTKLKQKRPLLNVRNGRQDGG